MQSPHHEPSGWARGKSLCQSFRRSLPQQRTIRQVHVPNLVAFLGLFSAFYESGQVGMSLRCELKFVNGTQPTNKWRRSKVLVGSQTCVGAVPVCFGWFVDNEEVIASSPGKRRYRRSWNCLGNFSGDPAYRELHRGVQGLPARVSGYVRTHAHHRGDRFCCGVGFMPEPPARSGTRKLQPTGAQSPTRKNGV